tara:strand:- start:578 stop:1183 length:606 start_codon:yes stop_codon:yes gene_type:complete
MSGLIPNPKFGPANAKILESFPRHPGSRVPNCQYQRRLDLRMRAAKLQAVVPLYSGRVNNLPPVRFVDGKFEASVTFLHDHFALLTESSLGCATMPGLARGQETLSNGLKPPEGLGKAAEAAGGGEAGAAAGGGEAESGSESGSEAEAAAGPGPVDKRKAPAEPPAEPPATCVAYAYDMVVTYITSVMAERIYGELHPDVY